LVTFYCIVIELEAINLNISSFEWGLTLSKFFTLLSQIHENESIFEFILA
jgi:hypothetical protein